MAGYNFIESLKRIDNRIENDTDKDYLRNIPLPGEIASDVTIPVNGTVLYVRIETELNSDKITPSVNSGVLQSFLTESSCILRSNPNCRDVIMTNESIIAVYSSPKKVDVDSVIDDAARIKTLALVVNKKWKADATEVRTCIAVDYGKLLMIPIVGESDTKAFTWYGEPLTKARMLAEKDLVGSVCITDIIWNNIKQDNQKLFGKQSVFEDFYVGNIVNIVMNNWVISK